MSLQFVLRLDLDNAAFAHECNIPDCGIALDTTEIGRLLQVVSKRIHDGHLGGTLLDINGNACGEYVVSGKKETRHA